MLTLLGSETLANIRREHEKKFPPQYVFIWCAIKYDYDQKFYFITLENDEVDMDYKIEDDSYQYEVGEYDLFKINLKTEMAYFSSENEQREYEIGVVD